MKWIPVYALLLLAVAAGSVRAEQRPWNDNTWKGQAELSYVATSGNTNTASMAGKNLVMYRFAPGTTGTWKIAVLHGKEGGKTTAESYSTELRVDRLRGERLYFYLLGGWNRNRFAGIDHRYFSGPGAGYGFLRGPKHIFKCEAGLNFTREDYTDGTNSGFLTGRAYTEYGYAFTGRSRFIQSIEFLYDFKDSSHYKASSETALAAAVTDIFSMKIGYTVHYDNRPVPAGIERTDTVLSAALVVDF